MCAAKRVHAKMGQKLYYTILYLINTHRVYASNVISCCLQPSERMIKVKHRQLK